MSISDKIKKSKEEIKYSQKLNVSSEIYNLISDLENRKNDREFLMTIPINIVASNESFFKETISSLIDFDEKYLNNSKSLIKRNNVKIDLEDIFHITKEKFSLGDLIAYSFKYSSIESLYKTFTEVSDIDIFKNTVELTKTINEGFELEEVINENRPIDKNRIFKNLVEAYEIRNVICHDFLSATHKLILDPEKLKDFLMDTYVLQEIITIEISEKIYSKNIPNNFPDQIQHYNSIIEEKKQTLNNLYKVLENSFNSEEQFINLNKNKQEFEEFLKNDSKYVTSNFKDYEIDLFPFEVLTQTYSIKLIEQRIKNLTEEINYSS
ncbi:hypothetical protein [Flavobacterium taihuense]|uniref:Uncharacterized protein n=1 Tax=Flavobacterium taihuense TaxID=2857508 RepID=A0ABS6Y085_9FLAO|nr:hypothetical protein [Flavobacterium taihuense]MBW4362337.1 hypothetical protein [Flavobacterium taihuense]